MKKGKSTSCLIFIIICLCFIFGVIFGSITQNTTNIEILKSISLNEVLPQKLSTYSLFVNNSKFFIILLFISFLSIGIPIIMFIFFINGMFYGYGFSYILSQNNINSFVLYTFIFNIIKLLPLLITGCFSSMVILKKFIINKNSKSYLKREKDKSIIEFAIIFTVSCIITLIVCFIETNIKLSL